MEVCDPCLNGTDREEVQQIDDHLVILESVVCWSKDCIVLLDLEFAT